jgi:hypothetical protein
MMRNPDKFAGAKIPTAAVQAIRTETGEGSESSLVERVCAFLDRYASAHADDAKFSRLWQR